MFYKKQVICKEMSFPWTMKYPLSAFSCSFPPKASKPADHKTATMKRNLFALIWAPATICKKVKKNTTYSVGRFHTYPAGEFFTFYFKLPRFHQLLAVYIITLKRVIWLPRREATAALPLIFWTPSAPLWQRLPILTGKQGNFWRPSFQMGLDWTDKMGGTSFHPQHTYMYTLSFLAVILLNFPKCDLKHFKSRLFGMNVLLSRNYLQICILP